MKFRNLARIAVLGGMVGLARGQDSATPDPLLDLLIKKGIITQQEATNVAAEVRASHTNAIPAPDSKWKINKTIKSIELFGDVRVRYEDRRAVSTSSNGIDLQRGRYAVRLGLRGDVFDNFSYGLRLETSSNPRSPWVTFGTSSSGIPYQGPFGKSTAGINVGQAYIGWKPGSWLNVTVGKMPNPIYTTPMVWDTDLNPEGVAESFKYTVGQADFLANFGQFIYQDTNPNSTSSGFFPVGVGNAKTPMMFAWQAGVNYRATEKVTMKVAPVFYNYIGAKSANSTSPNTPGFNGIFIGQGGTNGVGGVPADSSGYPGGAYDGFYVNQTGINNLLVLDIPAEINFKINKVNLRFFGDYAQNLNGKQRAQDAFNAQGNPLLAGVPFTPIPTPQTGDTKAYQFGIDLGSTNVVYGPMQGLVYGTISAKNAWEFRSYWQHIEQYALDPNLLDSDFFEGRANMEGVYVAGAYGLSDNVIGEVRYGYARRINSLLGTGGSNQDVPQMNPIGFYNLVQVDLAFRF